MSFSFTSARLARILAPQREPVCVAPFADNDCQRGERDVMSNRKASGPMTRGEVLLVSEHPVLRAGLRACMKSARDLTCVGETTTAKVTASAIAKTKPDLMLLDLTPPTNIGLSFIKDLLIFHPQLQILILSTQDESIHAEHALRAGAKGYVMEQSGCDNILKAIRHVLSGRIYLSPDISEKLLMEYTAHGKHPSSPLAALTEREFEVFQFIAQGKSTRQIAEQIHLSEKTVAVHRNHIRNKLKLGSPSELLQFAIRWQDSKPD